MTAELRHESDETQSQSVSVRLSEAESVTE